jgi:uncharacterized protein (DUF302 family)
MIDSPTTVSNYDTANTSLTRVNHCRSFIIIPVKKHEGKNMKKILVYMLIIFASTLIYPQQVANNGVIETRSSLSFNETIEQIKKSAEEKGWVIPAVHDLQKSLQKNGQEVLPVTVIELCNPEISGNILKQNDLRALSAYMPCRVSVYEKEEGDVFISRMNFDTAEVSNDLLQKASEEMEMIIMELSVQ